MYLYECRFVEKPFSEVVDGRTSIFDDMDFIKGVKDIAINKDYNLKDVEGFIDSKEGWWGIYGEYCKPVDVIEAYEKKIVLKQ